MGKRRSRRENAGQKNRTMQMFLWCGVILVQMAVLGKMDVHAMGRQAEEEVGSQNQAGREGEESTKELEKEITVYSGYYENEGDCPAPEEEYTAEDGAFYRLLSWEAEKTMVHARRYPVEQEVFLYQQEGALQVPEDLALPVEEGGKQYEVACRLSEKTVAREEWQDGFCFPVTFHGYYADSYWLGDQLITGGGEEPWLDGHEELLLQEIGVSPEEYRITDIWWEGEPYEDDTGEVCRGAVAAGQKLVRDYRLVYRGVADLPPYEAWRTAAVYGIQETAEDVREEDGQGQEAETVQIREAEATASAMARETTLWEKITHVLLVTIAIGAALFFGGLILLGILWLIRAFSPYGARKDRRKRKTEGNGRKSRCVLWWNRVRYRGKQWKNKEENENDIY